MKMPIDNLPDARQQLLLQAALRSGSACYESWQKWKKSVDLDDIEEASFRLVPLAYENLKQLHVSELELGKLRGISRYHWCKNQLLLKSMADLLRLLEKNGVTTLVLKGGALVYSHYASPALRPMSDIDIMVPREQLRRAIDIMIDNGWTLQGNLDFSDVAVQNRLHSIELKDGRGNECDLHWTPLWDATWDGADEHFWRSAEAVEIQGVSTRALGITEQFFHTIVHGSHYNAMPPIRWIADAVKILEKDRQQIDWNTLLQLAKSYGYLNSLQQGVSYLVENYPELIPEDFSRKVSNLSYPIGERLEYRLESRYIPAHRIDKLLMRGWFRHSRQKRNRPLFRRVFSFPSYIVTRMNVASLPDITTAISMRIEKIRSELQTEQRYVMKKDGRLFSDTLLEIMVTDHCNLSCRTCDHLAPVIEERFQSVEELQKELALLSQSVTFRGVKLIGGEPLLHPTLADLVREVRKSGICSKIMLVTNGTLLSRFSNELLHDLNEIEISQYPQNSLPKGVIEQFRQRAVGFSTRVSVYYYPFFQNQLSLQGTSDEFLIKSIFITCKRANLWGCHAVYDGYLFRCPQSIYLARTIPALKDTPFIDGLKISQERDFSRKIQAFFTGKEPLQACRYCLGTVGTQVEQQQVKREHWISYQQGGTLSMVDIDMLKLPMGDLRMHFACKNKMK